MANEKVDILGVNISRMNMAQAIDAVKNVIECSQKVFIVVPNVFVVTECNRDAEYKKIINTADIAFADGVPLVWSSYFLGKYTGGRVSGPDFFSIFNMISEKKGYSCYYLGGGPGGSEKVVENFNRRYPRLKIVGNFSPPLGEIPHSLNDEIIDRVNKAKPDILWVGLGAPRQEKWIYNNFNNLSVHVAIGVGVAFDYEGGKKRRAPSWMHKVGIEWSYRILFENHNLFWKKRYYAYFGEFILPVIIQIIKNRIHSNRKSYYKES